VKTTDQQILEALTGQSAPAPAPGPLSPIEKLATEALTDTARAYMTELQVKDGASPADARACTDIEIRLAYEAATKAGHDRIEALQAATRHLDARNAYYKGRTTLASTRVFAEAQARAYTPRILRQIKEA
jgi:hypothetical protein